MAVVLPGRSVDTRAHRDFGDRWSFRDDPIARLTLQTHLVTELPQLARPIMRRGTGLHADQAWRRSREKRNHLAAPQLLPHNHLLLGVDPVDLKYVLGDIQTDRGNLHLDGSPHVIRLRQSLYGTSMPGAGAVHHINNRHRRPCPGTYVPV